MYIYMYIIFWIDLHNLQIIVCDVCDQRQERPVGPMDRVMDVNARCALKKTRMPPPKMGRRQSM